MPQYPLSEVVDDPPFARSKRQRRTPFLAQAPQHVSADQPPDDKALLRTVLRATNLTIYTQNKDLRYTTVFGPEASGGAKRLIGLTDGDHLPASIADQLVVMKRRVMETGVSERWEITSSDQPRMVLDVIVEPQLGDNGRVIGILGTTADITAQRSANEQLHHMQRVEAVGQLTGGIAHDFNNLLGVMVGQLDLLKQKITDADLLPHIDSAIAAADLGASLIQRLLAFSRRQTLAPVVADIRDLILGLEDLLHRTLGETIILKFDVAENLWPSLVDRGQLESVILNLSINARDAMPDGGTLTIAADNHFLAAGKFPWQVVEGEYLRIRVTDTGSGIPADIAAHVFEPFFTTKEAGKGSGLGLSMVYGFVKQSGGHIEIDSAPGKGTAVTIYLPHSSEPASAKKSDLPPPTERIHSDKVLVVEDNDHMRSTIISMLHSLGYTVLSTEDAPSALEILRTESSIQVLVTDIVLRGGINGLELSKLARQGHPKLGVVFISGFADPAALDKSGFRQPPHFLQKPFRAHELGHAIQRELTRLTDQVQEKAR
jgi:signal transduction histidine kinase/ActR/RegA family two-component response regulator